MRELYVWYRVRDESARAALAAVRELQSSLLAAWPGLLARLLVRTDASGGQTWMETYAYGPGSAGGEEGVGAELEVAIAAASRPLSALIEENRHVESFEVAAAAPKREP